MTNPYRDLVDAENVRLMALEEEPVVAYIRSHYAPEAEAVPVRMVCGRYPVYRIVTGEPELKEKTIVTCDDGQWQMEATQHGDITGYLYRPDTDSFAADIYLGLLPEQGEELLFYTLQTILPEEHGLGNGHYSRFSVDASELEPGVYRAYLYLEDGDILYRVEAGSMTLEQA